jgi:hypothetical protein
MMCGAREEEGQMPSGEAVRRLVRGRRGGAIAAFVAYALLAVVFTWPLTSAPAHLGMRNGDYFAFTWALAAQARQLLHDPLHLFDSNLFWPQGRSLTYHDILLPEALAAAPILALGGGPLLAHNLGLLLTFPLAGLGAYLLAYELTRSRLGAFLAGLAFAFSGHRMMHLIHIPVLSAQWFPFALLFFLRCLRRPRFGRALGLFAAVVLQGLSSGYYAAILAVVLALACLFCAPALLRRGRWLGIALALGAAALVIGAASLPYGAMRGREGFDRGREICVFYAARPWSYVRPAEAGPLPHVRWLWRELPDAEPLFIGLVTLGLAGAGALVGRRQRGLLVFLTGSVVLLSLGPEIVVGKASLPGPYGLLRLLPLARMMRDPSRFGAVATLGLAVLAAWGLAVGMRKLGRAGPWLGIALTALVALELYPGRQQGFRPLHEPPASVQWLADAPRGPVLELPWDAGHLDAGAEYMYWSTGHWQPMVNGAGAFLAPANVAVGGLGRRFPDADVVAALRGLGVRYVVVHLNRLPWRRARHLRSALPPAGLVLLHEDERDETRMYVIQEEGERRVPDWIPESWRARIGP